MWWPFWVPKRRRLCGLEITVLSFFRSHLLLSFSLLCVMVVYSSRSISLYCLFLRTNVVWPISWEAVNPLFSLLFCGQKWATAAVLPFFRNQDHIWDNCAKIEWERKIDITKCWIIIWALQEHPLNCQRFYGSHIFKQQHFEGGLR